ncbi:MAG: fibronectin type III-like domain-contianing protein, partial [Lachnospiraceae bacterium]|nr:fibronectin type III-like domain-contianing protein [Lachnospiraceae bacterium]
GQVPVFYGQFRTDRPCTEGTQEKYVSRYLDIPNRPLYPFGYGLSYTTFAIGPVQADAQRMRKSDRLRVSVTVKNTGSVGGSEVVQMYLADVSASVARPVRELRGFQKIYLEPGEEREVSFEITEELLRFHDIHMNYVSEPGEFRVYVGNSSETKNEAVFWLE